MHDDPPGAKVNKVPAESEEITRLAESWFKPRLEERIGAFRGAVQNALGQLVGRGQSPSPAMYSVIESLAHREIEQRGQIVFEGYKRALTASQEPAMKMLPHVRAAIEIILRDESVQVREAIQPHCSSCRPVQPKDATALRTRTAQKIAAELEFLCMTLHNEREGGIPIFAFKPDSVKMTTFAVYEQGQLATDESLQLLIDRLYVEPECEIKYYYQDRTPMDEPLAQAVRARDIVIAKSEFRYFRHPSFAHDYVRILKDDYKWDWQKDVAEQTPEFVEVILELGSRKRTEMDTINKVHLEEQVRQHLKYQKWAYVVFLSYSDRDRDIAALIEKKVSALGGKLFLAPKEISPGDDFAEIIRNALVHSQELWLLVSPSSINSEWVISEWGAAWALEKRIVPILYRCDHTALPDRLRKIHSVDLHRVDELIAKTFSAIPPAKD